MKKLMSMVLSILFSLSLSSFAFAQAEEAKKAEKKIMPINAAALAIKVATIGGPTAIIEIDGYRIMTDPSLDSAGTEYPASVPLVKTMNPAMQVKEIGKIDLVLLSHAHADHLDHQGRKFMMQVKNTFTTVSDASRINDKHVAGLKPWEYRRVTTPNGNHLRITATPALHGPRGIEKMIGDVIGFVISLEETREDLIYITGDTVFFDGLKEVRNRFNPRTILLYAGAAQTLLPVRLTMDTNEVLETAHIFSDSIIVPVHCDGWKQFRQSKEDIKKAFEKFNMSSRLLDPKPGVMTSLSIITQGTR